MRRHTPPCWHGHGQTFQSSLSRLDVILGCSQPPCAFHVSQHSPSTTCKIKEVRQAFPARLRDNIIRRYFWIFIFATQHITSFYPPNNQPKTLSCSNQRSDLRFFWPSLFDDMFHFLGLPTHEISTRRLGGVGGGIFNCERVGSHRTNIGALTRRDKKLGVGCSPDGTDEPPRGL